MRFLYILGRGDRWKKCVPTYAVLRFHSELLAPGCFVNVLQGLGWTTSIAHQLAQSCSLLFQPILLILDMINHFIQWYVDWVIDENLKPSNHNADDRDTCVNLRYRTQF